MNKKNNEFSSYNQASKNLELKVRSLNEAYGVNKTVEILNPEKKEELMVEMTDAMKASLARYRQIMNNAAGIMNESSTISATNTGTPEAPKTTSFSPKLGEPFTNAAEAKLDSDLKATASDPEKQGEPFGDKEKTEEYKDAQYVPDGSVANKKPSGGKVVRVNESDCAYEESIEECEEWGSCGLPSSEGVGEVGDDAPFTNSVSTVNEGAEDFAGFADEAPVGEGEEEESLEGAEDETDDIDLDDIDIDLDADVDDDDESLDDIDTEEKTDDNDELAGEDSELEALRAEVEELRNLVNQLIGDEEEMSAEDDMDADVDNFDVEFDDMDTEDEMEGEDEMFPESRQYVQRIVEDVVQYVTGNPKHDDEYRLSEVRPEGKDSWSEIIRDIEGFGLSPQRERYSINCAKNLYRLYVNMNHLIKTGEATEENMTEISDAMDLEMRRLIRNTDGNTSHAMTVIQGTIDAAMDKIDMMFAVPMAADNDQDFDNFGDEEDVDVPEVDTDNTGFEDEKAMSDDEMDAMAYAGAEDFDPSMFESRRARRLNEEGTKLNVFGKHPGYRKKPMNLPSTGEDKNQWGKDWNDDSVYSEQPFGEKIGTSAPFEEIVKTTVDSIVESIKKKR